MTFFAVPDLSAVRRLMSSEPPTATSSPKARNNGTNNNGLGLCPGCGQAFDLGKKRRLVDACGHERCYSCMFRRQECPLCQQQGKAYDGTKRYLVVWLEVTVQIKTDLEPRGAAVECSGGGKICAQEYPLCQQLGEIYDGTKRNKTLLGRLARELVPK